MDDDVTQVRLQVTGPTMAMAVIQRHDGTHVRFGSVSEMRQLGRLLAHRHDLREIGPDLWVPHLRSSLPEPSSAAVVPET